MTVTLTHDCLVREISRRTGLSPREDWSSKVEAEAAQIAETRGWSLAELLERLDEKLITELAARLTVSETFFLRHEGHFGFITDFLSARLAVEPDSSLVNIWSAGCASGEEPFSVAISVREGLGEDALKRLRIDATDLSIEAIERARTGRFGAWSFRGAPAWLCERYFECVDDKFQIDLGIQRAVTFECTTIFEKLRSTPDHSIDVILFRNVAIYLEPWAWQRVYGEFAQVLKRNGLLVIAPSDPTPERTLFERLDRGGSRFYRPLTDPIERDVGVLMPPPTVGAAPVNEESTRPTSRTKRSPRLGETKGSPRVRTESNSRSRMAKSAKELADRGELVEALALATQLVINNGADSAGFVVRGQLHMAMKNFEDAISDFRSALFIDPEDLLSRFWYCVALESGGREGDVRRQLLTLDKQLSHLPASQVLQDGETRVSDIKSAVLSIAQRLS